MTLLDRQVLGVIRLTLSRFCLVCMKSRKQKTNLKIVENVSIAKHINEFNTITNQLSSVEIDLMMRSVH